MFSYIDLLIAIASIVIGIMIGIWRANKRHYSATEAIDDAYFAFKEIREAPTTNQFDEGWDSGFDAAMLFISAQILKKTKDFNKLPDEVKQICKERNKEG